MKQLITLLLLILCYSAQSQTISTNIGTTTSAFDSSFVVQTAAVDSFSTQTHPGASGYSNGEILVCEGATLKYNCMWGTSSQPTFYLEKNATLILYQDFSAKVYMKEGAILNCNNNNAFIMVHRVASAAILNNITTPYYDSVYTQVNYTFNAWPSAASPCNAPSSMQDAELQTRILLYPNPASSYIKIENALPSDSYELMNLSGSKVAKGTLDAHQEINIRGLSDGLYTLVIYRQGYRVGQHKLVKQ